MRPPREEMTIVERLEQRGALQLALEVCAQHGIAFSAVLGRSRHASVVRARHALFVALRSRAFSYPEIGWMTCRDHTTVLAACQKARRDHSLRGAVMTTQTKSEGT